jgi:hypothetical protein
MNRLGLVATRLSRRPDASGGAMFENRFNDDAAVSGRCSPWRART